MKAHWGLFLCVSLSIALAAPPSVTKVEPPDWPAEAAATTLRVLLTGSHLTGARVASPFPCDRLTISTSGNHLLVELHLPAHNCQALIPCASLTAKALRLPISTSSRRCRPPVDFKASLRMTSFIS